MFDFNLWQWALYFLISRPALLCLAKKVSSPLNSKIQGHPKFWISFLGLVGGCGWNFSIILFNRCGVSPYPIFFAKLRLDPSGWASFRHFRSMIRIYIFFVYHYLIKTANKHLIYSDRLPTPCPWLLEPSAREVLSLCRRLYKHQAKISGHALSINLSIYLLYWSILIILFSVPWPRCTAATTLRRCAAILTVLSGTKDASVRGVH